MWKILLGNRDANFSNLTATYSDLTLKRIKQVHKDQVVETSLSSIDLGIEADSHWTQEKHLGLCVVTADCCPIFLISEKFIAGIHAGWRGIENRIVPKTLEVWKSLGIPSKQIQVVVGPHIQKESFEVQEDVKDLLLQSCLVKDSNSLFERKSDGKFFVDLQLILRHQLIESGIETQNMYFEKKDTFQDLTYHSFRRDKEKSGRQISFIARTS